MKLFPDDPGAAAVKSKFVYLPAAEPPEVTEQVFASWPPHMQTEFAALAFERGAGMVTMARRKTGVTAVTLDQISTRRHSFMLLRDQGYHVPDDEPADPFANGKKKRSGDRA